MKRISLWMTALLWVSLSSAAMSTDIPVAVRDYDVVWNSQSRNSSESMPCGGGDIGLNVWVEQGDLLFYMARSGTFDENNTMLKLGRVRIQMESPIDTVGFEQRLNLAKGSVDIQALCGGIPVGISVWVDVFKPVVHVDIQSGKPQNAYVSYESWRYQDRLLQKNESYGNSYKWSPPRGLKMRSDRIGLLSDGLWFRHENPDSTMFDVCVAQQGLSAVKDSLYNPLGGRVSGGSLRAPGFQFKDSLDGRYLNTDYRAWRFESRRPRRSQQVEIVLTTVEKTADTAEDVWMRQNRETMSSVRLKRDRRATEKWWQSFWERSFVRIDENAADSCTEEWKMGRNYQLFRYQLACNAYGEWPTKFNGGLFTFDPVYVNPQRAFSPDFRNWGGGTFTAQNQRLVYFPMLKNGDFDLMPSQFDFYLRLLGNAEWRSRYYWNHEGACFTEQIENFALPNPSEYGWKRPEGFDPGMEYNKWLEYLWDTSLEFCHMIMQAREYGGMDIERYLPLVESVLRFFDGHYRMLARERGEAGLPDGQHLRFFPGSACETYKITDDAASTVAGLQVLSAELEDYYRSSGRNTEWLSSFRNTLPALPLRRLDTIAAEADSLPAVMALAPARSWERVNNTETPQLYPVYPWRMYHLLSPEEDLEIARNTYCYDPDVQKFYSHVGWKQFNIFAACLGLSDEAMKLSKLKFADSENRFPTFWGPGFDWTPDHNWGGSAMIGLQEMLLQSVGDTILVLPSWPADRNVHFRLHAPARTEVEVRWENGELKELDVIPEERRKDVIVCPLN